MGGRPGGPGCGAASVRTVVRQGNRFTVRVRGAGQAVGEDGGVRDVVVLGSTGSVGTQALDVVRANPDRFRVVALTAGGSNPDLFERQVAEFRPGYCGLGED